MPCSDKSWHILWDCFNRLTTETIRVPRADLEDVVACGHDGNQPAKWAELVATEPRSNSATVEVHRDRLYIFLSNHPRVCDAP